MANGGGMNINQIRSNLASSVMLGTHHSAMSNYRMEEPTTNRIHFFKFDQRILSFYNIDTDKKTREILNIDFNIPIRFCSI